MDILPTPESSTSLDSQNQFQRLDRVTPPLEDQEVQAVPSMLDAIIPRPRLEVQPNTEEAKGNTQDVRGPAGEGPRRSQRNRTAGENFHRAANFVLMAKVVEPEAQTLTEAANSEAKAEWKEAWESELSSLAKNQTWVLERLPLGRTAIGCSWLFKRMQDGRYKARLVAKGDSERQGIDYEETFAPVAKFTTIRVLLALSCESDWEVHGMDVKTAFLNSELEETVYMEIPEGVELPAAKPPRPEYTQPIVCRLQKSIYGLKQSPLPWYGRINEFFLSNGFI